MIIFYQFDCITFLPVTQTVTGKTESIVSYFLKLMLISGIFLLIKGATVIEANKVSSAFAYSSYSSEAFPTRCVHEEISAIPVL